MKPIVPGTRGPAVEDVQRRLFALGYDLGRTGVDGVFLGRTAEAVRRFQQQHGLIDDGVVEQRTWAALVDSTFTLGDRMLYLRLPHFHGHDVEILQKALSILGFAPGELDGIFGIATESAVRDFQRSCGHPADGIFGPETAGALDGLRHLWLGKEAEPRSNLMPTRIDEAKGLMDEVRVRAFGAASIDVAERFLNLATVIDPETRIGWIEGASGGVGLVLSLADHQSALPQGAAVAYLGTDELEIFSRRLRTAITCSQPLTCEVFVILEGVEHGEGARQKAATRLLEGLRMTLA